MSNLKNCPDCGHKVSLKAASCPKCGRTNPGGVRANYLAAQALVVIFGVLMIGGMLQGLATQPGPLESQFSDLSQSAKAVEDAFAE